MTVPEILDSKDHLLNRVETLNARFLEYYEFIAYEEAEKVEEELKKNPRTWAYRMRIAPVVMARVLPERKQIERGDEPKRVFSPEELKKMGLSKEQILVLAGMRPMLDPSAGNGGGDAK